MTEFREKLLTLLPENSSSAKGTYQIYRECYPDSGKPQPKGTGETRYNAVQDGLIWLVENGFAGVYSDRQIIKWYRAA